MSIEIGAFRENGYALICAEAVQHLGVEHELTVKNLHEIQSYYVVQPKHLQL